MKEPDDDGSRDITRESTDSSSIAKASVEPSRADCTEPLSSPAGFGTPVSDAQNIDASVNMPTPTSSPTSSGASERLTFLQNDVVADRYRIDRFIGRGGMGEVYEVEDLELREHVALKTIRPNTSEDARAIERFKKEIQLARRVTHHNVCRIFDLGYHRTAGAGTDITFLTMELLRGETLSERLRATGQMTAKEALPIVIQMATGLAEAHKAGIVHRDFKSGNIILVLSKDEREEIRAVVTDFGLARPSAPAEGFTSWASTAGVLAGTPAYMSPEQVLGREITPASDIYALGVVMYEMVTGTLPFVGESHLSVAAKRLDEAPPSPRTHVPDLDLKWEKVILRCLERNPQDRFGNATDVIEELRKKDARTGASARVADNQEKHGPRALTKIGQYQIEGEVGRGSMGVVYQCFDPVIGRTVAIKTMHPVGLSPVEFAEYKARFQREAQVTGALNHPNIVTVYEFGEDNGVLYMAMEFLEGKSIQRLLDNQNILPIETILPIYDQICNALDHAHQHKVVHRDIKPSNIMILESGLVKVMDFGIAKMMAMGMTQAGQILGTPNYMSPEQVKGRAMDGRSDIFCLGVMLYELVTGVKPFGGQNITTVIYKIINETPIPPRELDATHPGLSYVISKALAKNPDERYQTCRELAEDLKNYKNLGPIGPPTEMLDAKVPPNQNQQAANNQKRWVPGAPTKLGRYQIVGEVGRGSMGVVYQGFDPIIGRTVAIKTMQTEGGLVPIFETNS